MRINQIEYERLSFLLDYYHDTSYGIPNKSGIYYWVYWPDFEPNKITADQLINKLIEFTTKYLFHSETIKGKYKYQGNISEQWFKLNGNAFGLSPSKHRKLKEFLEDINNRDLFLNFFKELCFSRPFYVGKANNLRTRLKQHFNSNNSEIINQIEANKIPFREVWIGYKITQEEIKSDINEVLEEIFSRGVKPGLTKKPN